MRLILLYDPVIGYAGLKINRHNSIIEMLNTVDNMYQTITHDLSKLYNWIEVLPYSFDRYSKMCPKSKIIYENFTLPINKEKYPELFI